LPLHYACQTRTPVSLDVIQYLIETGGFATLRVPNNKGALPIHVACQSQATACLDVIQYLAETDIQNFAETDAVATFQKRDLEGCLPLHLAITQGGSKLGVIKYLAELDPTSLSVQTLNGDFPFMQAGVSSSLEVIHFIIRQCPQAYERGQGSRGSNQQQSANFS